MFGGVQAKGNKQHKHLKSLIKTQSFSSQISLKGMCFWGAAADIPVIAVVIEIKCYAFTGFVTPVIRSLNFSFFFFFILLDFPSFLPFPC